MAGQVQSGKAKNLGSDQLLLKSPMDHCVIYKLDPGEPPVPAQQGPEPEPEPELGP